MQSTEEYLDQLLALVNEQDAQHKAGSNKSHKKMKPIEELDESELTEEVLQKQLALLLGLEVASDEEEDDSDDFMTQYAAQVTETASEKAPGKEDSKPEAVQEDIMDIPEDTVASPTAGVTNTGVLSPDEIAELFASMENNAETETKAAEPEVVAEPEVKVAEPVPETSNTGVLSPDEIAELFASMENNMETEEKTVEPEIVPEPEVKTAEPAPEVSNTGVLSPDEIAALFASMGNDAESEIKEEVKTEEPEIPSAKSDSAPPVSDSGILSPDEIAALFASMGNDDTTTEPVIEEKTPESDVVEAWEEMPQNDTPAGNTSDIGLTREELEEIGLGDIADVLVDSSKEMPEDMMADLQEDAEAFLLDSLMEDSFEEKDEAQNVNEERQIIDIPDFDGEMLLDIDNVEAMLEATAKLAEEKESAMPEAQVEEDIMSMLSQFEEESMQESLANQEADEKAAQEAVNNVLNEEAEASEVSGEEEETPKKKKKAKKQKVKKEKPVKEKKNKVSLKDRIAAFMFEDESLEDESADDDGAKVEIPEDVDSLDDLELKPAKAKKEKASKKKKKEAKGGKVSDENAAIEAELEEEDKKKTKKKEKPVKEKKPKKVVVAEKTPAEIAAEKREARHSIGTKGIVATLLVCASLLGLILVGTYFLPRQLSLMTARAAFYNGNYEEAAMRFMGQDLNESDKILYEKAGLLYGLEERYHQYEIYVKRGMTKDALDTLLQGVIACDKEANLADRLGIMTEWKMMRDMFTDALQEQYGLDSETVEQICGLRNPDYTVAVENVLVGRTFDDKSNYGGSAPVETPEEVAVPEEEENGLNADELEDLLPEEEAIIEQLQQENEEPSETQDSPSGNDNELYSGSVEGGSVNFAN